MLPDSINMDWHTKMTLETKIGWWKFLWKGQLLQQWYKIAAPTNHSSNQSVEGLKTH